MFPDDIECTINIDGLGVRTFLAHRAKRAFKRRPLVMKMLNAGGLWRKATRQQVSSEPKPIQYIKLSFIDYES